MNHRVAVVSLTGLMCCGASVNWGETDEQTPGREATAPAPLVATFSIVAFDPETGELGIAVQSRLPAVGAIVPFAKAGISGLT